MGAVLSECLQRSHFPVAVDAEGAPFAGVPTAREGSPLRESHSHLSEVGGGPPRDAVAQSPGPQLARTAVVGPLVMGPAGRLV